MLDIAAISTYVSDKLSSLGQNKKQEIVRLVFEISKRENKDFKGVLNEELKKTSRFLNLKRSLIKRRYPSFSVNEINDRVSLPSVSLDPELAVVLKDRLDIYPKNIFIEESVLDSELVKRARKRFTGARFSTIDSYSEYVEEQKHTLSDYNDRLDNFFIIKEKYDFFIDCPCSPNAVCCKYQNMKLGTGCAFECMYCYMQAYINSPGIVLPANINDFFEKFSRCKKDIRLGNGQFTDSLVFDPITGYSPLIVDFFRGFPETKFEFKTKSDNIDLLLEVKPADNIIVSWTINPQNIIDDVEFYTASLDERLNAAYKCFNAGYKVGFHFDPIIIYKGCEEDYSEVVDKIFSLISEKRIAWISLGCLRMTTRLKQVIENRFPDNKILDQEMVLGFDQKLRYGFETRLKVYAAMRDRIKKFSGKVPVYLCMEEDDICRKLGIFPSKEWLN